MAKRSIPPDIVLRNEIRPGDIGYIIHLHGSVYSKEQGWDSTFEADIAEFLSKFCRSFNPARERLLIAEKEGKIVGSIGVVGHSDSEAQLRFFLVEPGCRGKGLGAALLDEAVEFCKACGYESVYLWTFSALTAAGHLYKSKGFKIAEENPQNLFGTTVTEQRYVLKL